MATTWRPLAGTLTAAYKSCRRRNWPLATGNWQLATGHYVGATPFGLLLPSRFQFVARIFIYVASCLPVVVVAAAVTFCSLAAAKQIALST